MTNKQNTDYVWLDTINDTPVIAFTTEQERDEFYKAALKIAAGMEWRDMDSAPKDGTRILCRHGTGAPFVARFAQVPDDNGNVDCWVSGSNWCHSSEEYKIVNFTHWLPLPPAPEEK